MRKKLLFLLCVLATVISATGANATREFTVAASNVDGLPPVVEINVLGVKREIKMNPDGSQETGATRMGQLFAGNLWDIVGLSEDFNYHNYIIDGVAQYYNASTYRGRIEQSNLSGSVAGYLTQSVYMKTDGLCMLSRKNSKVLDERIVRWNEHYGYDDHEADGLIDKGYRFYQVCLEGNLVVDVYIMHMDAGSDQGDIDARTSQLKQLVAAIKASDNRNPIIILGDTNCRYTRDTLKKDFIDAINEDPRFEIHDPWVDFMWEGVYPEFGTPDMTVGVYGEQKGEVVDKVFYINNSDSECRLSCNGYLHDDTFTYADGSQIADHYPVVAPMVIEGPATPEPPGFEIPEAPEKTAVVSGQIYFLRNLGSGEFLRAGGAWTSQAVMGDYPSKVTPVNTSGDKYTLKTTHQNGNGNQYIRWDGNSYYMDQASNEWTLTQVSANVYTLTDASGQAVGHANGVMAPVSADASDLNQQWEFLTQADLLNELYYASSSSPRDATFLMKAPDFGFCDQESWTSSKGNNAKNEKVRPDAANNVSFWKAYNTKGTISSSGRNWSISQTVDGLPAGTYKVTYQLMTYNLPGNHTFTINGTNAPVTNLDSDPGNETVARNLAAGMYSQEFTVTVTDEGAYANKIEIKADKSSTKSPTGAYYDNFRIKCIGIEGKIDQEVYDRVKAAIDDAQTKADELGLAYNNRAVESLWRNYEIAGDGWNEVRRTYTNLAEAVLKRTTIPADYTYAIVNNSFELYPDYKDSRYNISGGYPFGWIYSTNYAYDSGVWPATDADKKTDNPHGEYIYNTWDNGTGGNAIYQEIALTPGIYELTAMVASDTDNTVFLFAGNGDAPKDKASVKTTGASQMVPVTLHFGVSDGKPVKIGVCGANGSDFSLTGGSWYKADNFRLRRIGDSDAIQGREMVQLAIDDATAKSKALGNELDLSKYQTMLDNYTLAGDGMTEFNEIYAMLRELVFAKGDRNVDMTEAIVNNSFEWGNLYGWETRILDDTKVVSNADTGYKVSNADGSYIFNTWGNGSAAAPITQTIYGMRAGQYELKALVASDSGNKYFLAANGQHGDPITTSDKSTFTEGSVTFDVAADGDIVTFGVYPTGSSEQFTAEGTSWWYKADNFRLTRKGNADMTAFYDRLRAAMAYASAQVATLPEPYNEALDLSKYQSLIDNETLEGDGSAEIEEIYTLMRGRVFSQTEPGADYTTAIFNPGFETGTTEGWIIEDGRGDTGIRELSNATYAMSYGEGSYLYNTYDDNGNFGAAISQVIPGVPAGRYSLKAVLSSWQDRTVMLTANGETVTVTATDAADGIETEVIFALDKVTDLTVMASGVSTWFKADNFRLTLVEAATAIEWTMETPTHGTLFLPFSHEVPEGLEVYAVDHVESVVTGANNEKRYQHFSLVKADRIEAHEPYVVTLVSEAAQTPSLRTSGRTGGATYLFTGVPVEATATDSPMTGTHEGREISAGDYSLRESRSVAYFSQLGSSDIAYIEPAHAFIAAGTDGVTHAAVYVDRPTDEDITTGVEDVIADGITGKVSVWSVTGLVIRRDVVAEEALQGLAPGVYIITDGFRSWKATAQ